MIDDAEAEGPAEARFGHHRADLRQHRHRPGVRRGRTRLPHHHRHAGDHVSVERRQLMKAYGAELVLTDARMVDVTEKIPRSVRPRRWEAFW